MPKLFSTESGLMFLLGAIIGKTVGAMISTYTYIDFLFDPSDTDIFLQEFTINLISGNIFHIALALVCGLLLVVWKVNDLFD